MQFKLHFTTLCTIQRKACARGLVPQWNMVSVLKFPNWQGQLPDCADFNVANANKPTLIPDFLLILMRTKIFMVCLCLRKSSES